MINTLVVDDEPINVDGIALYLAEHGKTDWDIQTAYGSMAALANSQSRIDFLISDIMMPVIDGFALQQQLLKRYPRMKTIFLTGYPELDNAQKAIRAENVVDYVLKTEDEETVLAAVLKAVAAFNADMRTKDILTKAQEDIKKAQPLLQRELLFSLLRRHTAFGNTVRERFYQLGLPLRSDAPVMLVLAQFGPLLQQETEHDLQNFALENIMDKYLFPTYRIYAINMDSKRVVYFLQSNAEDDVEQLFSLLEGVQQTYTRAIGMVAMVMDRGSCTWDEIGKRYAALVQTLERNMPVLDGDMLMKSEDGAETKAPPYASLLEMRDLLESREYERAAIYLQQMPQPQTSRGKIDLYRRLLKLYCLTVDSLEDMESHYHNDELPALKLEDEAWSQAIRKFSAIFASMSRMTSTAEQRSNTVVIKVKEYVREHLPDDLSLTQMAEVVGCSPSNLSRVFKQLTGMGYNDYIVQQRMSHAAQLLCTKSRIKLNDISMAVGYATTSYFIRVFREHFGMTPNEYRKANE